MRDYIRERQLAHEQSSFDLGSADRSGRHRDVSQGMSAWTLWKLSDTDRAESLDDSDWATLDAGTFAPGYECRDGAGPDELWPFSEGAPC